MFKTERTWTFDVAGLVWMIVFLMIVIPGGLTLSLESLLALVVIDQFEFKFTL
jgi:hypothetical protein